jgi:hypothetical protein
MDIRQRIKKVIEKCKREGTYIDEHGTTTVKASSKLKFFTEEFAGDLGIYTDIMTYDDCYIGKAKITSPEGTLATGHAKIFRNNKPKAMELAETFAISRALSTFGIMDESITSKEELDDLNIPYIKVDKSAEVINYPKKKITSVKEIIRNIDAAMHLSRLKYLKDVEFKNEFNDSIKNHPATYKDLMNHYETRKIKLQTGAKQNG